MNALPGLPGGPPLQREVRPMQELHQDFGCGVEARPDGSRALAFRSFAPQKVMVFILSAEDAEAIGKQLAAPSVVVPNGNGQG